MANRKPLISSGSEGRKYKLGAKENTEVTFKADGEEVANEYAITEWWLEADGPGPDPHVHENNDELIYVLEGTVSVLLGEKWSEHTKGSLIVIPAGTTHTFANQSTAKMGILNIVVGSAYEFMMPQITQMFANK